MGYIVIRYKISSKTPIKTLVDEIEWGHAFLRDGNKEKRILTKSNKEKNKWVSYEKKGNKLTLYISEDFLHEDSFFEKILTSFLYNLIEFDIKMENIKIPKQKLLQNGELLKIMNFPLIGTIFKPYYHLSINRKVQIAKKFIQLGGNFIKEDETYYASKNHLLLEAKIIQNAIGENGFYIPNITPYVNDYVFVQHLIDAGIKIVMINFFITGFRTVYDLKKRFPELTIWGHRIGYKPFKKYISMEVIALLATLAGINFIHIGTPNTKKEINRKKIIVNSIRKINPYFIPVFTKVTPSIIRLILDRIDKKVALLTCGYIRAGEKIDWEKTKHLIGEVTKNV